MNGMDFNVDKKIYFRYNTNNKKRNIRYMIVVLFDFETNGTESSDSVLEAMFNKIEFDNNGNVINRTSSHRYYLLKEGETYNFGAYAAHGLLIEDIIKLRGDCSYPKTFNEDMDYTLNFLADSDLLVAHNIDFDCKFLPDMPLKAKFCTMKDMKAEIQAKDINGKIKNPTLAEACSYFGLDFDTDQAHGAKYDTDMLTSLFEAIVNSGKSPFFKGPRKPSSGKIFIRSKLGDKISEVKENLFEVDGFWFALSDSNLGHSTGSLQVYEKRSGNLFYVELGMNLKTFLSDIQHGKVLYAKISAIISEIGADNLKLQIDQYIKDAGETSTRSLFD